MRSLLLLAAAAAAFATPAFAQRGPSLTLYDSSDLQGDSRTFFTADGNLSGVRFNDRARSLQAEGRWEVCMDADFRSACRVFEGRVPDLGGFSGLISSVRPLDGWRGGPSGGWGSGGGYGGGWSGGRGDGLIVFSEPGFRGDQREIQGGESDFRSLSFNDRAQSLAVRRGTSWQVCEDINFGGRCVTINRDVPDLAQIGLSGRISSVRSSGWSNNGGGGWDNGGWDNGGWGGSLDSPSATGRRAGFFARPTLNGRTISTSGRNADQMADEVCRRAGWRDAAFYSADRGVLEDLLCVR
jgi:hypothetical protein